MDVAFSGLVNIVSFAGLWALLSNMKKEQGTLESIESSRTFTPSRLRKNLKNDDFLAKWVADPEVQHEFRKRVFIEGITKCDKPIKSIIDKRSELIYSLFYRDDIYSNDTFIKTIPAPQRQNLIINAPLYFQLMDPDESSNCAVHRSLDVEVDSVLEKIADAKTYKRLSMIERVLIWVGMIIEFMAAAAKNAFTFRGFRIGWQENEYGIKTNSVLTAYGDVIYNRLENSIRMENPLYFLAEKSALVKKFRNSLIGKKALILLMGIPFVISGIYLIRRFKQYMRAWKLRKEEEKRDRLRHINHIIADEYKCSICCTNPRNIILKPCLHFLMCHVCYELIKDKSCPICKQPIYDAIEIFFS